MKFDKETIIVFVVCMILLVSVEPLFRYMGWIPPKAVDQKEAVSGRKQSGQDQKAVSGAATKTALTSAAKDVKKPVAPVKEIPQLPPRMIGDDSTELQIDPNRGTVLSVTLKNYFNSDKKSPIVLDKGIESGALNVSGVHPWKTLAVIDSNRISPKIYSLTRRMAAGEKEFILIQEWSVSGFVTDYSITIKNPADKTLTFEKLNVVAGGMPMLKELTGDKVDRDEHRISFYSTAKGYDDEDVDDEEDFNDFKSESELTWVASSNKYFTTILKSDRPFDADMFKERLVDPSRQKDKDAPAIGVVGGSWSGIEVPAKGQVVLKAWSYNGPKELALLEKFDKTAINVVSLAPGPLKWIARVLLALLLWLYNICGSYGWSIILLTLIVRGLLWPLTQRANQSMKRMQKLKPEIDKINEKYSDNPQMKNTKVMQLYRDHKINPVGGCLPILLQIPIFIALYNTLNGAVQLRQVSFLWAADLTMPDTVATIFGLGIHPLVLMMTGLMLLQQKMMPTPADAMQQKMMMMMPLVMLVFLYNLPSGLTLYWTVSQICSIAQMYINQKVMKDPDDQAAASKG